MRNNNVFIPIIRPLSRPSEAVFCKQLGGVVIEFALAFPVFFALFYGIVSYSLILTLHQSLTHASTEGARAAIQIDRMAYNNNAAYEAKVAETARNAVAQTLTWLPQAQKALILGSSPTYGNIQVTFTATRVTVTLNYPYNQAPIIPVLTLPVIGRIPNVPNNFVVSADSLLL
jgi:Flp pilus assembly protein TadG